MPRSSTRPNAASRNSEQLSLRELARAVGVSHAAPRSHFPDRQALLDALAERGFDRLAAAMRAADEASGAEFAARLRAVGAAYVDFGSRSPALLDLMYTGKRRGDATGLQIAMAGSFSVIRELIGDGIADGVLAPGDLERYAFLLFSWMRGIAALVSSGVLGPESVDELISDTVTTFVRGSAAPLYSAP